MPTIPYFEVLAFTKRLFGGNPAGVCLLEGDWLPAEMMQQIAHENNLAETAFLVKRDGDFDLRWFTPAIEVDLCGHATLASAHVLFARGEKSPVTFHSRGGALAVSRQDDLLELDFPARPAQAAPASAPAVAKALGAPPAILLRERDFYAVFARESDVAALQPDFAAVAALDRQGVVATAPGDSCDFVSRYFAPAVGIPEDPVTGSTHCTLIPYWTERLGKKKLHARQISERGGELFCENRGARVGIGGSALTYVEGMIHLP